jgi:adenylate cyclase
MAFGAARSSSPVSARGERPSPGGRPALRRLLELWGAGVLVSVLVTGASAFGYLEHYQARMLDLVQRLGGRTLPPEVALVAIDEAAFAGLGARQPIPRDYLARVIRGLARSGAAVVGLDVAVSVPTAPEADQALADALREFADAAGSRVVLLDLAPPPSGPLADPALLEALTRGSDRVPVDADGVVRRVTPWLRQPRPDAAPAPILALALLWRLGQSADAGLTSAWPDDLARYPYWRASAGWAPGGGPATPLHPGELWRITFAGPPGSLLTVPSDAVAALGEPGAAPPAEDNPLRGRVVLVGATFVDSRDFVQTPVGRLAGVEVHASLVHMLATRRLVHAAGWLVGLGAQLLVVAVAGLVLTLSRPLTGTLLTLALTLALGLPASYLAFHRAGYAVDVVLPVLATCALGLGAEAFRRRRLVDSFGQYVGREVLRAVLADSTVLLGDRREVSILVSDLRGFTTLSETMPAERVAAHLNEYFPAMVDAIFTQGGMINDFIGDGILAVFGAPVADRDHVAHAVSAALGMQEALARLNRDWAERGLPALRMGIGVHTGPVFAGNVGGPGRIKYTVVGDVVNSTARLEGLNKELGTTTLITEEVRGVLGDRVATRYCGEAPVKGRAQPLRVYELLAVRGADGTGRGGQA